MAVELLSSYRKEGPAVLARAPRCAQSRGGLPQRIIIGFIQALDFAAVEALIPDLQPRAERLWVCVSPQRHNGAPQPQSRNGDIWCGYLSQASPETVRPGRCSRRTTCLNSGAE